MLSYWEKQSFTQYDVAIIGAGITGVSTAISLKEKYPKLNLIVLEKGLLPTGASTKNAGFACVGSLSEILDDLKTLSQNEVLDLVKLRKEGLEILRNRLGDKAIEYKSNGSYELLLEKHISCLDKLDDINRMLKPLYAKDVFKVCKKDFGFSNQVKAIVESTAEGEINTGKMMKALLHKAMQLSIEIKTGFEVKSIEEESKQIRLVNPKLTLCAKKVCICTNAFSKKLLPEIALNPGRGQVLITAPIANLKCKGIFHFDEGYYYFRVIDNRILFGGGRNIDFETETTYDFEINKKIQEDLEEKLRSIILPNQTFSITQRWSGIMAFGKTKQPILKKLSSNIYAAVRFGGMGIAIGSKAGENISQLISNDL